MKLFDDLLRTEQAILDYFNIVYTSQRYPIEDCRTYLWKVDANGHLCIAHTQALYDADMYWVYPMKTLVRYPSEEYTMIMIVVNGDNSLYLLTNAREMT